MNLGTDLPQIFIGKLSRTTAYKFHQNEIVYLAYCPVLPYIVGMCSGRFKDTAKPLDPKYGTLFDP